MKRSAAEYAVIGKLPDQKVQFVRRAQELIRKDVWILYLLLCDRETRGGAGN